MFSWWLLLFCWYNQSIFYFLTMSDMDDDFMCDEDDDYDLVRVFFDLKCQELLSTLILKLYHSTS